MSVSNRHLPDPPTHLAQRLVRYGDLEPCTTAFVDTRTPGSDRKENFTIIGPGVAENPDQHVHIELAHGFNIGGARQPPNCTNSQHSHETAEVFMIHSGTWAFRLGETGADAEVVLHPGDTISIPTRTFRGFENVGDDLGFMFAVLGGDDPGRVTWAPYVFDAAAEHGLVLLENGALVDTVRGEQPPADVAPMQPTSPAEVAAMQRLSVEELEACVARADDLIAAERSLLTVPGVTEYAIIGGARADGMPAGPLAWLHGFQLRCVRLAPDAEGPVCTRAQPEVLLVHAGSVTVTVAGEDVALGPGDVFTVPADAPRQLRSRESQAAVVFIVDGTDAPSGARLAGAGASA